jgi:hypothetical protein
MNEIPTRKWTTSSEEIHTEGGPAADAPLIKAAVAGARIHDSYAGRYAATLDEPIEPSGALAVELVVARHARAA